MGWFDKGPLKLLCDNLSASSIAKNPINHKRTKHIDVRYHFIRDKVNKNEIIVEYVNTQNNVADILTKGLSKQKHCGFLKSLGFV